ncbi:DUF7009 family protein [Cohaesibacter haloalkalitolerans]|uniref:DUF7009 family protein n=1 Tax=Cohaesibacter haloalkalitolerans TaxID=1162980 RepID=UPI000E65BAD3|nr:hypothetical protein [Cohaesibacter haloalkalitolerans]
MNFRIDGQKVRFRIDKSELECLCNGTSVIQATCLSEGQILGAVIEPAEMAPVLSLSWDNQTLRLAANIGDLHALRDALPQREGLKQKTSINDEVSLDLSLEVDIRTQNRKRD